MLRARAPSSVPTDSYLKRDQQNHKKWGHIPYPITMSIKYMDHKLSPFEGHSPNGSKYLYGTYIGPKVRTTVGPRYIPHFYMDPLGQSVRTGNPRRTSLTATCRNEVVRRSLEQLRVGIESHLLIRES